MSVKEYKKIKNLICMTRTANHMATKWQIRKRKIAQTINVGETVEKDSGILVSTRSGIKVIYKKLTDKILVLGVKKIKPVLMEDKK